MVNRKVYKDSSGHYIKYKNHKYRKPNENTSLMQYLEENVKISKNETVSVEPSESNKYLKVILSDSKIELWKDETVEEENKSMEFFNDLSNSKE